MPNRITNVVSGDIDFMKKFFTEDGRFTFELISPSAGDARKSWGTNRDAYDVEVDEDVIVFRTAWSTPMEIWLKLIEIMPNKKVIYVNYADEDIGSNCGRLKLQRGCMERVKEAGGWDEMVQEDKDYWEFFALRVTEEHFPDDMDYDKELHRYLARGY